MGDGRLKGAGVGFTDAHEADLRRPFIRLQHEADRPFHWRDALG